jgi:hypothetical protein
VLSATAIPSSGGTFSFTGTGGANVGAFSSTLTLSPLLSWTNQAAVSSVNRRQRLLQSLPTYR